MTTNETISYTTHASPIGTLVLAGTARGLRFVQLAQEDVAAQLAAVFPGQYVSQLDGFFDSARQAFDAYFAGAAPLALPIEMDRGTPLQRAVWLALSKIPYGETITYSMLAERVGFLRAVRAVASACGANPLPLVIPCHRVIAKDGTLGGFSLGGIGIKEQLLAIEAGILRLAA